MTNLAIAFLRIEPQALGDIPGVRCVNAAPAAKSGATVSSVRATTRKFTAALLRRPDAILADLHTRRDYLAVIVHGGLYVRVLTGFQ